MQGEPRPPDLPDTLEEALPEVAEAEAVRIRGLLWPAELLELRAIYDARVRRRPTTAAMAVLGVLHDAARRSERVEQDELARRAGAGTGTVVRVLGHLRAAGVVASEGGEFVPRRGKATCQRHRLTASPALVAVTTPERQVRLRAYAWLSGEGGMAPDDARALLRSPVWRRELWRRLREAREAQEKAVLSNRTDLTAAPNTAGPPALSCAPGSGTDSWGTSATLEGSALQVAPVPEDPDGEESGESVEMTKPATPLVAPSRASGAEPPGPGRRGAWVEPDLLAAVVDEAARRVGEREPAWTAAALYGIARHQACAEPLRAVAAAYARGAAEAVDEAQERRHRSGCQPVRDLAGLAFVIARRELRGEGPPPWPERPERRPRRVMPPASPPPAGEVPPRGAVAAGPGPAAAVGDVEAVWAALDAEARARAAVLVEQEQPALARWTRAEGPIWRQAVVATAARRAAGAGEAGVDPSRRTSG